MHLLIECLGRQPNQWFPVLLGEPTADTPAIREILTEYFGENGFIMDKVPHSGLSPYYRSADVFVSCSPRESFGLAMVEALYHGLPVVAHDFFETKWVLGNQAILININNAESLKDAIHISADQQNDQQKDACEKFAVSHYSWKALSKSHFSFFKSMVQIENIYHDDAYFLNDK
jgi:glycosyltransferase involved in cell wall biosynthesis